MNAVLTRTHHQRLRQMYRSAGWPCLDAVEIDLLAAGLLERLQPANGPEYLRVTDAGLRHLSDVLQQNRSTFDQHEALVTRIAEEQVRNGRIAYRGLALLGKPGEDWLHLRPDVFSIRNTTVEDYVEPVVHEIKVKRADLRADLKKPDKRATYLAVSSECYYVIAAGIAEPDEIPPECGVIVAHGDRLELARVAPKRPMKLSFGTFMALAKADRVRTLEEGTAALL
jgi:hypothetical protein